MSKDVALLIVLGLMFVCAFIANRVSPSSISWIWAKWSGREKTMARFVITLIILLAAYLGLVFYKIIPKYSDADSFLFVILALSASFLIAHLRSWSSVAKFLGSIILFGGIIIGIIVL
ncbi:MAG: hypothetical protein PHQ47_00465 [Candidatus Portnoybacteria bacterium]|nr:hypothetical protein [Candidatus Portnoybacteria bacterium]